MRLPIYILLVALPASPALYAQNRIVVKSPVAGPCIEIVLPGGARGMYCVPSQGWNGDLLVFAHGYTAVTKPLDYQNLTFGDVYLPELAQQLGFAFATTTYRQTGLTILEGVEDVRQLVQQFPAATGKRARRFIMAGASEGGIITALALERYPGLFAGGLSLCGPLGTFKIQTDYISDCRALFDYYFPGILPGNAVHVPVEMLDDWYSIYVPAVLSAVRADPDSTMEMLDVAGAAYIPNDMATVENSVLQILWYHTFGASDAQQKLGGNPYGNESRHYRGSSDDTALNAGINRFAADRRVVLNTWPYNTSGKLSKPLVVLHTTDDEVVPFRHELVYLAKAKASGTNKLKIYPIERYGHCNFTINEVIGGILVLLREMR